jgi:hypothetical protein
MRSNRFATLAFIAAVLSLGTARAQITTVILADEAGGVPTFEISKFEGQPSRTATLKFVIGPPPYAGAKVTEWRLRVVPTTPTPGSTRKDQDVIVRSGGEVGDPVKRLSVYDRTPGPQDFRLDLAGFKKEGNVQTLFLETPTVPSNWSYYCGRAPDKANRPRLILTYGSLSPPPARSGDSTDWKYAETSGHFSSTLLAGGAVLLANPVSYDGAVYVIASPGPTLYRLAGAQPVTRLTLPRVITQDSFAFATTWGRLQIITQGALASYDLRTLGDRGPELFVPPGGQSIGTVYGEPPAMGPDGTVYFKRVGGAVANAGSVFAYNPSLKEIWTTALKFTKVSRVTLNASGRFAYALVEVPVDPMKADSVKQTMLVRIATASGESVAERIQYRDTAGLRFMDLDELLPPVVATRANVDYVFVAGNKKNANTGLMQLRYRKAGDQNTAGDENTTLVWTRHGKVATAPVLSVLEGNSLFAVQDGQLKQYPWFHEKGAVADSNMNAIVLRDQPSELSEAVALLIDAADSLFVQTRVATENKDRLFVSVRSSDSPPKWKPLDGQDLPSTVNLLFTTEGALIGYDHSHVYDLSPQQSLSQEKMTVDMSKLANKTIYSAQHVTVKPNTAGQLNDGDQAILKGQSISFPKDFIWPKGKILKAQVVPAR